ncbi:MAG: Gx transporter family protein [Candidatus Choladocola sp.]|nr:Gx transporter family protein [Candidatus Choladocola sp.]
MRQKAAYFGVFTALAMILSYIEAQLPFFYGIPGVKLGLANSMSLTVMYLMGPAAAYAVSGIRIILTGFLFGNMFSILYSLAGGLLSLTVMLLMRKSRCFSIVGISMAGGLTHNIGQLAVAVCVVENLNLMYYLPVLLISGTVTGLVIGILSREILKRMPQGRM